MKKVLLLIVSTMLSFALISCGGEKKNVVKIGVYEPASGDNLVFSMQIQLHQQ